MKSLLRPRSLAVVAAVLLVWMLLSFGVTQEAPAASAEGRVVMSENGKPLAGAMVTFTPTSEFDRDVIHPRYTQTKADGKFQLRNLPIGSYEMEISAKHHFIKPRTLSIEEGKINEIGSIPLNPTKPYVNLYSSQRVFTPDEKPELEIHGYSRDNKLNLSIYRLDLESLARAGGIERVLYPISQGDDSASKLLKQPWKEIELSIDKQDAEGAFVQQLKLPFMEEGIYAVKCSLGDTEATSYLNITNLALVTKQASNKALSYAVDIRTGQPVAKAEMLVLRGDHLASAGLTDPDGLFSTDLDKKRENAIAVRRGKSVALVGMGGADQRDSRAKIILYTDRPIYRPGDTVQFKGIVRKWNGTSYVLPARGSAHVEIHDTQDEVIQKLELPLSVHGTYYGSFSTPSEAAPGDYRIVTYVAGSQDSHGVTIAAYRKPEFTVTVRPLKPFFILGNRASAKVKCEYYFGGPVPGAKVKATVSRAEKWSNDAFDEPVDPDPEPAPTEPSNDFRGGEYSQEIEAVTDANGEAVIEFDTRAKGDPVDYATDFTYTVQASVAESGDKYFDGTGDVTVTRGAYDLHVDADNCVLERNQPLNLTLKTFGYDGKPVANRPVEVTVGNEEWTHRTSYFVPAQTVQTTTNANGVVHLSMVPPRGQSITVRAMSRDDLGDEITAETSVWRDEENPSGSPVLQKFQLTVDQKTYAVGASAKVLIQTDDPGGSALLTVEADDILIREVVPISKSSTVISIPVRAEFAPNAFVSAVYIRDKKYMESSGGLAVLRPDRRLNITVTPNRPSYSPGDTASLTIHTATADGKPASADVSLGVVDESIYAIQEDELQIRHQLYPERYNAVRTAYSFPVVYLDGGDKGGANIPIRTKFKDTAFWAPEVVTDATGIATVTVPLPDNLTQWRATAVGITDDSAGGIGRVKFRCRKDLMVRLEQPSYLVSGDVAHMTVVVTNDTDREQDVNVAVDAKGVVLDGAKQSQLHIAAGQPGVLEFNASSSESGTASVTARAWIPGGASDGVRQSFPIHSHAREKESAFAGDAKPSFEASVSVLGDADRSAGELTVTVAPSIATSLIPTLRSLVGFPYGCVEQTMSRFMPSVVVSQTLKTLHLPATGLENQIPKIAEDSFARLARMQHSDGGWGWWEYDSSDPFMTALVLDGLDRARAAGYEPKYVSVDKAVAAAEKLIKIVPRETWLLAEWPRNRAYLAYVLSRYGHTKAASASLALANLKTAGAAESALVALTAAQLGDVALGEAALLRLTDTSVGGELTSSWASEDFAWGEEPTALALTAFASIRPSDPIVEKIVRYLLAHRHGDMWTSTRDTAYSVVGLSLYLQSHNDLKHSTAVTVFVDGRQLMSRTLELEPAVIHAPISQLTAGSHSVRVESSDGCYCTVQLRQFQVAASFAPIVKKGLSIERKYYKLAPRTMPGGSLRLMPSGEPISSFASGELIRAVLTIRNDQARQFLQIEDPLPGDCHMQDQGDTDDWTWWWSQTVVRDDRVAFFARWMPAGVNRVEYTMRAESPGVCSALPAIVQNMYDPTDRAETEDAMVRVSR